MDANQMAALQAQHAAVMAQMTTQQQHQYLAAQQNQWQQQMAMQQMSPQQQQQLMQHLQHSQMANGMQSMGASALQQANVRSGDDQGDVTAPHLLQTIRQCRSSAVQTPLAKLLKSTDSTDPMQFIHSGIPIFKMLNKEEQGKIARMMNQATLQKGRTIFKQGQTGDAFYIIISGTAHVLVHDENYLKVGDKVRTKRDVHFGGKRVLAGAMATVDKFDCGREYPYTIRIAQSGQRGRVLQTELELVDGPPPVKYVAQLGAGDYFGEQALLQSGSVRNATVVVGEEEDLRVLTISKHKFKHLGLAEKLPWIPRKAVAVPGFGESTLKFFEKSPEDKEFIKRKIEQNNTLHNIVPLTEEQIDKLADVAVLQSMKQGEAIMKYGDMDNESFYIIKSGEIECTVPDDAPVTARSSYITQLSRAASNGTFGEMSLLYHIPPVKTVTVKSAEASFWVLHRSAFKKVLLQAERSKLNEILSILNDVESLSPLLHHEKVTLAEAASELSFNKGDIIAKKGETSGFFYLLINGTVNVVGDNLKLESGQDSLNLQAESPNSSVGPKGLLPLVEDKYGRDSNPVEGKSADPAGIPDAASEPDNGEKKKAKIEWFGERTLLRGNEKLSYTVTVTSQTATVLALKRSVFSSILLPLENSLLDRGVNRRSGVSGEPLGQVEQPLRKWDPIALTDLTKIAVLGAGGFGTVTLQLHEATGETYALKQLSKGYVVKKKMQRGVMREKQILFMCNNDFIVKAYQTFKDDENLYFLMKVCLGGELFQTYHKYRFHGSVTKCKFYTACVITAFDYFHSRNVLYRDLKPENLLLDHRGYCKVTDMGLAKILTGAKTFTTCGTPDYFAPEVVQHQGQNLAVDWWTLGVLIHELLTGHAPFESSDTMHTVQRILRGVSRVDFSTYRGREPDAVDLVCGLLQIDPAKRLPMRQGGAMHNLRNHPWFEKFPWNALWAGDVKPPYVPVVKDNRDRSNFREPRNRNLPATPYEDPGTGWDNDF